MPLWAQYFMSCSSFQQALPVEQHTSVGEENSTGYFGAAYIESDSSHGNYSINRLIDRGFRQSYEFISFSMLVNGGKCV